MMRRRSAATRVSVVASLGFLRSSISAVDFSLIVRALFSAAQAQRLLRAAGSMHAAHVRSRRAKRDSGVTESREAPAQPDRLTPIYWSLVVPAPHLCPVRYDANQFSEVHFIVC